MSSTPFIITIDTEGDNLWARPRDIRTRNAAYLPRFQALCERFGFKPVYLTTYEMAMSEAFVDFGRDVLARGAGEVGMHLHAWNSPPLHRLTEDDFRYQPYLIEYPARVMKEKIFFLSRLLEDRFDQHMVSHRAGRWAFDSRYAEMLLDEGYRVDCSVTPGVDWRKHAGAPGEKGGTDYSAFPHDPYYFDCADISKRANGVLLEVPVTVRPGPLYRRLPLAYRIRLVRRYANRISPGLRWLCPAQSSLASMLQAADDARAKGAAHLEFMLHSSELMPGGSRNYPDASSIDRLYEELEILFATLSSFCSGMTLREFPAHFDKLRKTSASGSRTQSPADRSGDVGMART